MAGKINFPIKSLVGCALPCCLLFIWNDCTTEEGEEEGVGDLSGMTFSGCKMSLGKSNSPNGTIIRQNGHKGINLLLE